MSSGSTSKSKRADIDRVLLMRELKAHMKELKTVTRAHVRSKRYAEATVTSTLLIAYDYLYNRIERGIYDVMPRVS